MPERPITNRITTISGVLVCLWLLAGCSGEDKANAEPAPVRATLVDTLTAETRTVEVLEEATGYIETETAPNIAAEVAGQIIAIHADIGDRVETGAVLAQIDPQDYRNELRSQRGEVNRLEALVENQQRLVTRYRSLVADDFVSETALDDAEANLKALTQQLATARARLDIAERNLDKTTIRAPVGGEVQQHRVSKGTFVDKGNVLFQLSTTDRLKVHLPFPETLANRLQPGLPVRLESPTARGEIVTGTIAELRPMVGSSNRALEVIVDVDNPGGWRPGASVDGRVVLATRQSVVLPDFSVVLRPAGDVAYVIEDGVARQRVLQLGETLAGGIEVISGITPGETVAGQGAYYLSDGAPIRTGAPEEG